MKTQALSVPDVVLFTPTVFGDDRGLFMESYNARAFAEATGCESQFVQDNHSKSQRGVLRGLHYQLPPHAQGKLVRVTQGSAFDVAVDLRHDSPTFGKWVGVELNAKNRRLLWIPEGFAHGFLALDDNTNFLYKTTSYYHPGSENCILWCDPDIAIEWPLDNVTIDLNVSPKDMTGNTFSHAAFF